VSTLWDLLKNAVLGPVRPEPAKPRPWTAAAAPAAARARPRAARRERAEPEPEAGERAAGAGSPIAHLPAQQRYEALVELMCREHDVRVRKWRSNMSGVAYYLHKKDGTVHRCIESPRPKGPMSAAVFLHEIGHHAIGLAKYKPRCLEEYLAWSWSLEAMRTHGIQVTEAVDHRVKLSLWYAADKALRRGLKALPPELEPYRTRPPRRRKAG
jgi:hypothetical protein